MAKIRKQDALDYHALPIPGKIEVIPTKDTKTQRDLALAYSPGVAEPCLEIAKNKDDVYKYTGKGNLVAVISNGTAVLGLGNIGPEASKPVMEGKGILFKIFAGIDVFDIELDATDPEHFISVVKALAPTFGGINLEDIKAPDCFVIEERLKEALDIPIMHDDQHGTAIITGAGLLNALEVADKKIDQVRVLVSGAGASAISCTKIFIELGVKRENIIMLDSKGVIRADRTDLDSHKRAFATHLDLYTIDQAMEGIDVFLGLSKADVLPAELLLKMAKNPIVFALANPDPEIKYELAIKTRPDIIMATGRSDYPNQVNNVLGFPFIFRGALDVRAKAINEEMKLAAVRAIASLAKTPVPDLVLKAYNQESISFGNKYIIPKPLDPRLLTTVAPAVAKAAMDSGVARISITDWAAYEASLRERMSADENTFRLLINEAKQSPQRIVFAEADNYKILKAAQIAFDEGIAHPILLGNKEKIKDLMKIHQIDLGDCPIYDPLSSEMSELVTTYAQQFFQMRQRRGFNLQEAQHALQTRTYFGLMMLHNNQADGFISGLTRKYADIISPALSIIGPKQKGKKVSSMYMMLTKKGPLFFADTTMIANPTADELVDITIDTVEAVRTLNLVEPRVVLLSYSNFGSSDDDEPRRIRKAVEKLKAMKVDFVIDGEVQANVAFSQEILKENFPFSDLCGHQAPNVLIFPNLSSANIAYKLLQVMNTAEAVGPILVGMNKPVQVLQIASSVREIVNMITLTCIDAQYSKK